ncbi:MAG: MBL fold metallo-hydrolase [Gemmatimonadetes bacterium]|nr:MBL fold metallo-hydrolase [Gemmatimonadota bacterium]
MSQPLPLLQTTTLGDWTVHLIQAGGQQLDGGAMFGIVPKPLWSKRLPADERNRIPMGMRTMLIEHESGLILVDTGAGNKENEKFYDIYGIDPAGPAGFSALEAGIRAAGHAVEDVRLVINTHLHFDHAGGNTTRDASGAVRPSFPNARYVVQKGEYHYATHTNERTAGSYFDHNFVPLAEAGLFDFVDGDVEVVKGIHLRRTPGHVPHHQSVFLAGATPAMFLADVIPTAHHLPLAWIMGYDVEPLRTLESKRELLARAVAEDWTLVFEHDAHTAMSRVAHDGKSYVMKG